LARAKPEPRPHAEVAEDGDGARAALPTRDAPVDERQLDVLDDRELRDEARRTDEEADAAAAQAVARLLAQAVDAAPLEPVAAGLGAHQTAEDVEQQRLAGAGRPEHRDVLAAGDRERDGPEQ